jgi:hypothetical protein
VSAVLHWSTTELGSCFYALDCVRQMLPVVDRRLTNACKTSIQRLERACADVRLAASVLWQHLPPLSCDARDVDELAVALNEVLRESRLPQFVECDLIEILDVCAAPLPSLYPRLGTELGCRQRPIREQWDARGPGLLLQAHRASHGAVLPDHVAVHLVHPALGGGGFAHPIYGSIRFESVLANRLEQLSEVVRLAWLIAQLPTDVGKATDPDSPIAILPWAVLPLTLYAAAEVQLVQFDQPTLALALAEWDFPAESVAISAEQLWRWWNEYLSDEIAWEEAVDRLARST